MIYRVISSAHETAPMIRFVQPCSHSGDLLLFLFISSTDIDWSSVWPRAEAEHNSEPCKAVRNAESGHIWGVLGVKRFSVGQLIKYRLGFSGIAISNEHSLIKVTVKCHSDFRKTFLFVSQMLNCEAL